MAFVRRDVRPAGRPIAVTGKHGAAMRELASSSYLSSGDRVAGETAPAGPGTRGRAWRSLGRERMFHL